MKKDLLIKGIITLVLIALIFVGYICLINVPEKYSAQSAVRGNITGTVKESGNVHGCEDKVYYARVSAPISEFDIAEGDVVKKGDILLKYNTDDLEHIYTQASLGAKEALENADGAIKNSDKYASKYAKAKADDEAYAALYAYEREMGNAMSEAQYAEDYQKACDYASISKQIAAKQGEITAKQSEIAKYTDAFGGKLTDEYVKGSSGETSFDKSSKDYKKYKKLKEELDELNSEYSSLQGLLAGFSDTSYTPDEYAQINDNANIMEDISRNWSEAKADKASAEGAILNDSQKAALMSAADRYADSEAEAKEKLELAKKGVVSEFDGVVTSCFVKQDAYVAEGTPVFSVETSEKLKVELMISKYDIAKIEEGQDASINIAGNIYEGHVSKIYHLATNDSSDKNKIKTEVEFDAPDENVIIGVEADVTINTMSSEGAVLIPFESYYSDNTGTYVYVVENGLLAKKYFEAGIVTDEYVEVISGIKEGDEVIIDAVSDTSLGSKADYNG